MTIDAVKWSPDRCGRKHRRLTADVGQHRPSRLPALTTASARQHELAVVAVKRFKMDLKHFSPMCFQPVRRGRNRNQSAWVKEKVGGAYDRVQGGLKQEVELQRGCCSRVGRSRTGQLSEGSGFKTCMTSAGRERTGQTETRAESVYQQPPRPLPLLPPVNSNSAICLSGQPKTGLKQYCDPLPKSPDLFGRQAAVGQTHPLPSDANKQNNQTKSSMSTEKRRTTNERADILSCLTHCSRLIRK